MTDHTVSSQPVIRAWRCWWLLIPLSIGLWLLVVPMLFESSSSTCGAYLTRSARINGASGLIAAAIRAGVLPVRYTGPEAMIACGNAYWESYLDHGVLETFP